MEYFRERGKKRFWQNSFSAASLLIFFILWGKLLTIQSGMTKFEKKLFYGSIWSDEKRRIVPYRAQERIRSGFDPGSGRG